MIIMIRLLIKSALREAVISGKLNFRYIDRILFDWKRNGIKTIEQAKSHGRNVRQHQKQKPKVETVNKKQTLPGQKVENGNEVQALCPTLMKILMIGV